MNLNNRNEQVTHDLERVLVSNVCGMASIIHFLLRQSKSAIYTKRKVIRTITKGVVIILDNMTPFLREIGAKKTVILHSVVVSFRTYAVRFGKDSQTMVILNNSIFKRNISLNIRNDNELEIDKANGGVTNTVTIVVGI